MNYQNDRIAEVAAALKARFEALQDKAEIVKAVELKALYAEIPTLPADQRGSFGKEINQLKTELESMVAAHQEAAEVLPDIDVTAPFDLNVPPDARPQLLTADHGSQHPLTQELEKVLNIFDRMGFTAIESRELDDDWHMFTSLNFPEGHPARDDYDTFMTTQTDKNGKPLIAPAHTSTMQNRVLCEFKGNLDQGPAYCRRYSRPRVPQRRPRRPPRAHLLPAGRRLRRQGHPRG
jgi:phenylalanyl-tRNA synthetase alpha chain